MPKNPRKEQKSRVTNQDLDLFLCLHHPVIVHSCGALFAVLATPKKGQPFLPQSSSSEQMFVHFSGLRKPQPHLHQEARSDCSHLLHHPPRLSLGSGITCLLVYMRAHSTRAGTSLHPPAPSPVQDTEQKIFVD